MLEQIHVYPVKSLAGVDCEEAEVEPWGLRHDRRWLLLNPDGSVLTAREQHELLALRADPLEDGSINLTGRDAATLRVNAPVGGEHLPTTLSRLESVRSAGAEVDRWLSDQLGQPVRLGWLDGPRRRTVSESHGGQPGDPLSLADTGPLLLTTQASLRRLNDWIAEDAVARGDELPGPMVMMRFRPSVVVDSSDEPFAEDGWAHIRIGAVDFRLSEQCDRCVVTTIDPHTRVTGKEPLRTLARYRKRDHKVWFGIRLIPLSTGTIRIGDKVTAF
jgi:uncharacterized protein